RNPVVRRWCQGAAGRYLRDQPGRHGRAPAQRDQRACTRGEGRRRTPALSRCQARQCCCRVENTPGGLTDCVLIRDECRGYHLAYVQHLPYSCHSSTHKVEASYIVRGGVAVPPVRRTPC